MDARELRMGNLILRDNEEMVIYHLEKRYRNVWRVNSLDIDFDDQIQIDKLCSPIFLTEDWLVKFGFEEHGMAIRKDVTTFLELCWIKGDSFRLQTIESGFSESANCQYVHSLQNLYFALTGKELEIKNA